MKTYEALEKLKPYLQLVDRSKLEIFYQEVVDGESVYHAPISGYRVFLKRKGSVTWGSWGFIREPILSFRVTQSYLEMSTVNTCVRLLALADDFNLAFEVEQHVVHTVESIGDL